MGECDSPLHWHTYIYYSNPVRANRIPPRLYWPPFAFVHVYIHPIIIRLYHYFIEQMPIGRMRFAPTYFRIIPLTSLSGHIQLDEYIMGECDSPLHWHAYTYIPHSVRANRIRPLYIRPIYIPPFHPIHGRIRFAPTLAHIYIYSAFRTGESHSPPISIRPNFHSS